MKKDPLLIQSHVILGFLLLQYLLGMFADLFISFPDTKNETALWEFAKNQMPVVFHIVLAALLIIGGIVLLIRAILRKDKKWITAASIGLVALLIASFAGARFVPTQQDSYSYTMSVTFIFAFFAYGWGIYQAKK